MKKYVCLFIACLFVIVVTACSNEGALRSFQKVEGAAIKKNIDTLLKKLQYSNYEILVFPHGNYYGPEVSKKLQLEKFDGSSFLPQGPVGSKQNIPPAVKAQLKKGTSYYKKEVIVNYDNSRTMHKYVVEYFSVVVVFDQLAAAKRLFLKQLIQDSVLNENRNDKLRIVSKR